MGDVGAVGLDARVVPLSESLLVPVTALARVVWHAAFDPILPAGQVHHMLSQRMDPDVLRRYIDADDRWFDVLVLGTVGDTATRPIGYASCALTSPASSKTAHVLRLEQLYTDPSMWGRGAADALLDAVLRHADSGSADCVELTVNRRNQRAQSFYARQGFRIIDEKLMDIGGGYVMDDFVMAKDLRASRPSPAS